VIDAHSEIESMRTERAIASDPASRDIRNTVSVGGALPAGWRGSIGLAWTHR
jgi:hypothetical protein